MLILIGTMKNAINAEAIYTKIAVLTSLLIIHIGIIAEATVNIVNVLIGINEVKYRIMLDNATIIPPNVISLDFI